MVTKCCYLLRSLNLPRYHNRVYIGTTPDPVHRLRQHNGEIVQGAKKTENGRPWEMVMFVYGFPNDSFALQFEWAWQNPLKTRHRQRMTFWDNEYLENSLKHKQYCNLLTFKLRILLDMLMIHPYRQWPLKLHFVAADVRALFDIVASTMAGDLPSHMTITSGPLDTSPMISSTVTGSTTAVIRSFSSTRCHVCLDPIQDMNTKHDTFVACNNNDCDMVAHLTCLATEFLDDAKDQLSLVPVSGSCPDCRKQLFWGDLIQDLHNRHRLSSK
ncbi:structure-specific endonuclease subunit slx1 [Lichtheimia corymbifera JMRC:FSU:9682]|uniref:Structure-specific endonuclease subunit slx1 n=1 Tax=Lichtheimia corymbifera JMRC:FSU:9682 TaxID=1263082 RepID=A0A068RIL3_9FUNG|nr:structure-specific endonuclease subunit slx1 [Lichtheimia corymbifera JMRC:FSU:9682]